MSKHTPGPWQYVFEGGTTAFITEADGSTIICIRTTENTTAHKNLAANARLIAAAPDLLEALKGSVELSWFEDSHKVSFDWTVMFGPSYDFSGIDGALRQEFFGEFECVVWPSGGIGNCKWSAYCTYEGSMWFERFDTAEEAKEVCMCLLDKVLPDHPAMKARAAIAKATGEQT